MFPTDPSQLPLCEGRRDLKADAAGVPILERRLFLLDPRLPEQEIRKRYPTLWTYLEEGKAKGLRERYLCSHRALWYAQENRPAAPIVCTYLGRGDAKSGRPFRFILNRSQATVANVYLAMYPTPVLTKALRLRPSRRASAGAAGRVTAAALCGRLDASGRGTSLEPPSAAFEPRLRRGSNRELGKKEGRKKEAGREAGASSSGSARAERVKRKRLGEGEQRASRADNFQRIRHVARKGAASPFFGPPISFERQTHLLEPERIHGA
jgi:hypothetical protein